MNLFLTTIALALLLGYFAGGRLRRLGQLRLRWPWLALLGFALQARVPSRHLQIVFLTTSFVLLWAFAVANIRVIGVPLVFAGIVLNLSVMALNEGMPVSRSALLASGQGSELERLIEEPGAKHHLATTDDRLLFLGDVIPLPPIRAVVSVGDLFTVTGLVLLIVHGMLGRPTPVRVRAIPGPPSRSGLEVRHVDG